MYYGDKRESKVNICHTLQDLGWTIYGYKPDQSDMMTDYYDPASWDGIAEKNGYVLCIDISSYNTSNSGKEIYKYHRPNVTFKQDAKIKQLTILMNDRGATEGEKQAAKLAIERVQTRINEIEEQAEKEKTLVYTYPVFQANPPHSNWHIEKNGVIIAKGRGAFQFHNLPRWVDHMTEKPKDTWRAWELDEDQKKELAKFQSFINKVEGIASVKIGDGDEDQYKMITVTEYKTELKANEVVLEDLDAELEPNMCFKLMVGFNHGCYKGNVYKIKDDSNGTIRAVRLNKKLNKELTGRATDANSFVCSYENFKNWVTKNAISMCELVEVKTPYQVEKCVKVETEKPKKEIKSMCYKCSRFNSDCSGMGEPYTGCVFFNKSNAEPKNKTSFNYTFEVSEDVDTRDNSNIFLVKAKEKLSKEEYIELSKFIKSIGGYYSKFKHAFLFKEDPTEKLNSDSIVSETDTEKATVVKTNNKEKQIEKINKQIESAKKKIEALSGDYKTNTYKRMREQDSRDSKIRGYQLDISVLNYLLDVLEERPLTQLEESLIIDAFRTTIDGFYNRHTKYNSPDRGSASLPIKYPEINPNYPLDGWYNESVPKDQKRLNKAGIYNTNDLVKSVEEYGRIKEAILKPLDQTQQKIKRMERELKMKQKGDINFTPSETATELIRLARIDSNSCVLEPSAGIGNIADEIKKITSNVDVVERMAEFRELLSLKGHNLVDYDFLEYQPDKLYDAIIANPPFSDEQNHIKHMFDLLKLDGTLVTICSPHWTFANDKKSIEFRNWLEEENYYTKDLDSGTFEMTGVAAKILVIEKSSEGIKTA